FSTSPLFLHSLCVLCLHISIPYIPDFYQSSIFTIFFLFSVLLNFFVYHFFTKLCSFATSIMLLKAAILTRKMFYGWLDFLGLNSVLTRISLYIHINSYKLRKHNMSE
ncbi:hypothetical protein L9F63_003516, partial [Diploptera punctata]